MHKTSFEKALALSHVPRWAIVDTVKKQTVADHSYRVCVFALELTRTIEKAYPLIVLSEGHVLRMALLHDVEESVTGDVPTPFKRALERDFHVIWPENRDKSEGLEAAIVDIADVMEAVAFLRRYGVVRSGRVETFLADHLNAAKSTLFLHAVRNYERNMPGIDVEIMRNVVCDFLNKAVDRLIEVGTSYE